MIAASVALSAIKSSIVPSSENFVVIVLIVTQYIRIIYSTVIIYGVYPSGPLIKKLVLCSNVNEISVKNAVDEIRKFAAAGIIIALVIFGLTMKTSIIIIVGRRL